MFVYKFDVYFDSKASVTEEILLNHILLLIFEIIFFSKFGHSASKQTFDFAKLLTVRNGPAALSLTCTAL